MRAILSGYTLHMLNSQKCANFMNLTVDYSAIYFYIHSIKIITMLEKIYQSQVILLAVTTQKSTNRELIIGYLRDPVNPLISGLYSCSNSCCTRQLHFGSESRIPDARCIAAY